jgi:hypothetical protein
MSRLKHAPTLLRSVLLAMAARFLGVMMRCGLRQGMSVDYSACLHVSMAMGRGREESLGNVRLPARNVAIPERKTRKATALPD